MTLHPNSELLRQTIETAPAVDERFIDIQLVNFDPATGEKRGCFSLVFKAFDRVEEKFVALKFYDPDPQYRNDSYRVASFRREHEILQSLLSVARCLQLKSPLNTYELEYEVAGIKGVSIPCEYFAIEWLDDQVDAYFLAQGDFDAIQRLKLFNEIVLSVEALHAREVFHRDLKPDNLRAYSENNRTSVVAIDLGTAARFDSGSISKSYGRQVGAPGYAAPEARSGFADQRTMAPYNDYWALGCLLFELFNSDLFFFANRRANPGFDIRLAAMAGEAGSSTDQNGRLRQWHCALDKLGKGVMAVQINGLGSSVPAGIAPVLNEILAALTNMDYRNRASLSWVRLKVWSAIKILQHEHEYHRRLALARERRAHRAELLKHKRRRLEIGASKGGSIC